MAANPNPTRITDPMWRLWEESKKTLPGVRLGGIYAFKRGYHSSVTENRKNWPGDYSIRLPQDTSGGNTSRARAIDLTMSTAMMKTVTGRLRDSASRAGDDRLYAVREFYGTLDGREVFGRAKSSEYGKWSWATSDNSHLWHVHISVFAMYVDDWQALSGILSVISGEKNDEWNSEDDPLFGLKKGDDNDRVVALQGILRNAGFSPGDIDGIYGEKTSAALLDLRKSLGSAADNGDQVTGTALYQIHTALAIAMAKEHGGGGDVGPVGPQGPAGKTPKTLSITGATVKVTEWAD